jgi:hypothetical protein
LLTSSGDFLFNDLIYDLRHGLRQLAASPAFTATTIFTLALGVGAATAMFGIERTLSAVNLDVANPPTLVHVGQGLAADCAACGTLASGNFVSLPPRPHDQRRRQRGKPPQRHCVRRDDLEGAARRRQAIGTSLPRSAQRAAPASRPVSHWRGFIIHNHLHFASG